MPSFTGGQFVTGMRKWLQANTSMFEQVPSSKAHQQYRRALLRHSAQSINRQAGRAIKRPSRKVRIFSYRHFASAITKLMARTNTKKMKASAVRKPHRSSILSARMPMATTTAQTAAATVPPRQAYPKVLNQQSKKCTMASYLYVARAITKLT